MRGVGRDKPAVTLMANEHDVAEGGKRGGPKRGRMGGEGEGKRGEDEGGRGREEKEAGRSWRESEKEVWGRWVERREGEEAWRAGGLESEGEGNGEGAGVESGEDGDGGERVGDRRER